MRVLNIDEDRNQLETIGRGLMLMGHDVVSTTDENEALQLLERPGEMPVDLLLTDLTEPGAPGHRVVERARVFHPGLPIVALTGLLVTPDVRTLRRLGVRLLKKPFDPAQLARVLDATVPCSCVTREGCGCQRAEQTWSVGG